MAELNDVLGAMLRDIAQARVAADLFSRNVSLDYQKDEVLSGFPVPRVEVTQASIDLRFAVNQVEQRPVDPRRIMLAHAGPFAALLARQLYGDLIESDPRAEELQALISDKGLALESELPVVLERSVVDNLPDLEAAISLRPDALVRKLQGAATDLVLADPDLKAVLTRGTRVADIRERLSVAAAGTVDGLTREAAKARTPEGELDLARVPVEEYARSLGERVYADMVLANPRRAELLEAVAEAGVDLEKEVPAAARRVLGEDPDALRVALEGEPDELVERLESELTRSLLAAAPVKAALTRRTRITDIRTRVATAMSAAVTRFAKQVAAAIEAAKKDPVSVDVAVTTSELTEVPEGVISSISVTSEIRNYEWVTVGEDGAPVRRLQPE